MDYKSEPTHQSESTRFGFIAIGSHGAAVESDINYGGDSAMGLGIEPLAKEDPPSPISFDCVE
jgi:hypothetical protein